MLCPKCNAKTKVIDKRRLETFNVVRRRRECTNCTHRFTSYESLEKAGIMSVNRKRRLNSLLRQIVEEIK